MGSGLSICTGEVHGEPLVLILRNQNIGVLVEL